ncbi:hypothetical protein IPL85_03750 [Candidatus Saccharibacteria bacterium]|nr:MAG: hypothetical protein IPL85_03750 [Candidatus Saccharibacteria bacterium]
MNHPDQVDIRLAPVSPGLHIIKEANLVDGRFAQGNGIHNTMSFEEMANLGETPFMYKGRPAAVESFAELQTQWMDAGALFVSDSSYLISNHSTGLLQRMTDRYWTCHSGQLKTLGLACTWRGIVAARLLGGIHSKTLEGNYKAALKEYGGETKPDGIVRTILGQRPSVDRTLSKINEEGNYTSLGYLEKYDGLVLEEQTVLAETSLRFAASVLTAHPDVGKSARVFNATTNLINNTSTPKNQTVKEYLTGLDGRLEKALLLLETKASNAPERMRDVFDLAKDVIIESIDLRCGALTDFPEVASSFVRYEPLSGDRLRGVLEAYNSRRDRRLLLSRQDNSPRKATTEGSEALAAARQKRLDEAAKRAAELALRTQAEMEADAEISENMLRVTSAQATLLEQYTFTGKKLRSLGFMGKDSFSYILQKETSQVLPDSVLQTFVGLLVLASKSQDGESFKNELVEQLVADSSLRSEYGRLFAQLNSRSGYRNALQRDLSTEIEWLSDADNFASIRKIFEIIGAEDSPYNSPFGKEDWGAAIGILSDVLVYKQGLTASQGDGDTSVREDDEVQVALATGELLGDDDQGDGEGVKLGADPASPPDLPALWDKKDVIRQLDWEMFPPDADINVIKGFTLENYGDKVSHKINWGYVENLLKLRDIFGGVVGQTLPSSLGKGGVPYYVAVLSVDGEEFAIGESPEYGNATYVLRSKLAEYGASYREIFEQTRSFARLLGAEQVVHVNGQNQLIRIRDKIQELLLLQPKQ